MVIGGVVKTWDDDRGFGFVIRDDGQGDLFAHIREVHDDVEALERGQRVLFEIGLHPRTGRPEAKHIRIADAKSDSPPARQRSRVFSDADAFFSGKARTTNR